MSRIRFVLFSALAGVGVAAAGADEKLFDGLLYRNLGPFRAGAWISDIAVPERPARDHLYTFYAASRTGGLWKTVNNGTTFAPVFDEQDVLSIGAVAIAPSDPSLIWVGTGGAENARSTYAGDGVYRSTDGGATWRNMGLHDSHHVARIVIHPADPRIVYVAAMGHLFSPNVERGVFRSRDGGESWEKVLYVNENVGVIDLVMNRNDPRILYAAAYEKYRYPWHFEAGGPESGIYKTTNGGDSWQRLRAGLPTGKIGRIGLDLYRKNPDVVYAVVENANPRPPTEEESRRERERGIVRDHVIGGEVYRSDDGGRTFRKMNRAEDDVGGKAAYSFNQIRVDPANDQRVFVTSVAIANSEDGGRSWNDIDWPPRKVFPKMFGDVRTLWIDPDDPKRMIAGTDGGIHISYDGGKTSDFLPNLPLGEVYAVGVDGREPYRIYAGLQDHESWQGPSNSWSGIVGMEDWVTVGESDGMYNVVDLETDRWLYNTYQFGGHHRVDLSFRSRVDITPKRENGGKPYRFTWVTPIHISPHNGSTIYTGAEVLLRSLDRGDHWEEMSPNLTTNDAEKIAGKGGIQYCTITTISESPVAPGVVWVGTDDGKVWVTRDAGRSWTEVTSNLVAAGAREELWVSRVHASPHDAGVAFVSKTGRRNDDFRPYLFRTEDYGARFRDLSGEAPGRLPEAPVNVVFQDRERKELLYVGNDQGVFVSLDSGEDWIPLKANMPNVPVHDLLVHPRVQDLVVGTYGRGIWVTNVAPLQQTTSELLGTPVHLFEVPAEVRQDRSGWGNYELYGDRQVTTPNEPEGVVLSYYLRDALETASTTAETEGASAIVIRDADGKEIRRLRGSGDAGFHRVIWNRLDEDEHQAPPGEYTAELDGAGARATRRFSIQGRP